MKRTATRKASASTLSATESAYALLAKSMPYLKTLGFSRAQRLAFRAACAPWLTDAKSFSVGTKEIGGQDLRVSALVVRVHSKKKKPKAPIPPLLYLPDGRTVLTDVQQQPTDASFSFAPGDSLSNAKKAGPGIFTACVRRLSNPEQALALGCWHVLAAGNGTRGDEIKSATNQGPFARIGALSSDFAILSANSANAQAHPDYALVKIDANTTVRPLPAPLGPLAPQPASSLSKDQIVKLVSIQSPETVLTPRVISGPGLEAIKLGPDRYIFNDIYRIEGASTKGDSGTPVLDGSDRLVGYVIGDDAIVDADSGQQTRAASFTLVQPIWPLLKRLQLVLDNGTNPAANSSASAPNALTVKSAIDTLARTIWGEARGESAAGRRAVAWVVLNRVRAQRPSYGLSIEAVCRKPFQFSCWNKNDPNLPKLLKVTPADSAFAECLQIAADAVLGKFPAADPTHGATHYHTQSLNPLPKWVRNKIPSAQIGVHLFYNNIE